MKRSYHKALSTAPQVPEKNDPMHLNPAGDTLLQIFLQLFLGQTLTCLAILPPVSRGDCQGRTASCLALEEGWSTSLILSFRRLARVQSASRVLEGDFQRSSGLICLDPEEVYWSTSFFRVYVLAQHYPDFCSLSFPGIQETAPLLPVLFVRRRLHYILILYWFCSSSFFSLCGVLGHLKSTLFGRGTVKVLYFSLVYFQKLCFSCFCHIFSLLSQSHLVSFALISTAVAVWRKLGLELVFLKVFVLNKSFDFFVSTFVSSGNAKALRSGIVYVLIY